MKDVFDLQLLDDTEDRMPDHLSSSPCGSIDVSSLRASIGFTFKTLLP